MMMSKHPNINTFSSVNTGNTLKSQNRVYEYNFYTVVSLVHKYNFTFTTSPWKNFTNMHRTKIHWILTANFGVWRWITGAGYWQATGLYSLLWQGGFIVVVIRIVRIIVKNLISMCNQMGKLLGFGQNASEIIP